MCEVCHEERAVYAVTAPAQRNRFVVAEPGQPVRCCPGCLAAAKRLSSERPR